MKIIRINFLVQNLNTNSLYVILLEDFDGSNYDCLKDLHDPIPIITVKLKGA
jgi:hypothetical protein